MFGNLVNDAPLCFFLCKNREMGSITYILLFIFFHRSFFRKYHYLNTTLKNSSSKCYGLFDEEEQIGFIAVAHFPHPSNPKIKHISRLVILPDYQGIGLGRKFLNVVSDMYAKQGFDIGIVTSAKNLIGALVRDKSWTLVRYGKCSPTGQTSIYTSNSCNRNTASFFKKRV